MGGGGAAVEGGYVSGYIHSWGGARVAGRGGWEGGRLGVGSGVVRDARWSRLTHLNVAGNRMGSDVLAVQGLAEMIAVVPALTVASHTHTHTSVSPYLHYTLCLSLPPSLPPSVPPSLPPSLPFSLPPSLPLSFSLSLSPK
jgi:hypothetical protein